MIHGVVIAPLKAFESEKGRVMHMLKCTDLTFTRFGEVYFSEVLPGHIKAWSRRLKATRNYAVVQGNIVLALYDGEQVEEVIMGRKNHCLVTIPPGIWCGFKPLGDAAVIADLTDLPYDESDEEKAGVLELNDYWNNQ